MDEFDLRILQMLKQERTPSMAEMADQLNKQTSFVQFRLKRLVDHKLVEKHDGARGYLLTSLGQQAYDRAVEG